MLKNRKFMLMTLEIITTIILYYIVGNNNFFLYVLSFSLYKLFLSGFSYISLSEILKKSDTYGTKRKFLRLVLLVIMVMSLLFLILSIIISDAINTLLNINNVLSIFLFMGISIFTLPILNVFVSFIENVKNNKKIVNLISVYHILDNVFLLVIAFLIFRVFEISNNQYISLLYLSKIFSFLLVFIILFILYGKLINKKNIGVETKKINYNEEIKKILTKNNYKSIINIVENGYYYLSIITLYLILSTRYGYAIDKISEDIVFIYFFGLSIINYLMYVVDLVINTKRKENNIINIMYKNFEIMLSISIIFAVISPLVCKVIFNDSSNSLYLVMLSFMSIFIFQYNITFKTIKNRKLIYASLISGLVLKLILIIPLINSFYRMGYNLIYGDIISTIMGMVLSSIINYLYLKNKYLKKEKYFERILKILYENILLCITLILVQFIIPIKVNNYFVSLGILLIYILISIIFIKLKNKKRG